MSYNFANKVAIVTGGLSGIGLSTTIKLLRNGASVIIGDHKHEEEVDPIISSIRKLVPDNHNVKLFRTDVAKYQDNVNLLDFALDEYKNLSFVVANAGIANTFVPGAEEAIEQWQEVIDTNLTGVFSINKLAINYWTEFKKPGSIVNVGSIFGLVGVSGLANYCSAKGGVKLLTQALAADYSKHAIRINSVNPGYIHTGFDVNNLTIRHPIGRLGQPEEVSNTIAFLLSDEASFITGVSLPVDGGYTAI